MEPIRILPLIRAGYKYEYFGVDKEDYQLFVAIKHSIITDANNGEVIDSKRILQCLSMLHDIRLDQTLYYHMQILDFASEASAYFSVQNEGSYYFKPTRFKDPEDGLPSRCFNGFEDFIYSIVSEAIRKERRAKKPMNGSEYMICLMRAMKNWLINNNLKSQYVKGQIWVIACYITKHFFGKMKNTKLVKDSTLDDYLRAAHSNLKKTNLGKSFYDGFTGESRHRK